MRTLKTSEAAAMLQVSPNTLRAWERRFDYPRPRRTTGRHRLYAEGEIQALRDALQEGLSISSAISRAREGLSSDDQVLVGALSAFELERADGAMEGAIALRSVERAVEEVLLPALEELNLRQGTDSAPWAFAARWADGWLRRAHRLAPPPMRPGRILIGDATHDDLDPDALVLRAFELFCVRAGVQVLRLPVLGLSGIADVVGAYAPAAVVIVGAHESDDDVARWAYRVRTTTGPLPVALFRRGRRAAGVRTAHHRRLPDAPYEAQQAILDIIEQPHEQVAAQPPAYVGPSVRRRIVGA